jgi:hypothetical protein
VIAGDMEVYYVCKHEQNPADSLFKKNILGQKYTTHMHILFRMEQSVVGVEIGEYDRIS